MYLPIHALYLYCSSIQVNASTGGRIPLDEVQWRFEQIAASRAVEVDIWRMPVPPLWWRSIQEFMQS